MTSCWFATVAIGCWSGGEGARPSPTQRGPAALVAAPDLLTCELGIRAYELGEEASTAPSAPVGAGDGFIVAFTWFVGPSYELVTQRVDRGGMLHPPVRIDTRPGPWVPVLASRADEIVLVTNAGDRPEATPLAPRTGAGAGAGLALSTWPDDLAVGPRGIVATSEAAGQRTIQRASRADVSVPAIDSGSIPSEQIVASGQAVDVVLARRDDGSDHVVTAVVLPADAAVPTLLELFRTRGDQWGEASIAAGDDGFLVVRDGPEIDTLQLIRLDAAGARVGDPIVMHRDGVSRYPRAAALASGWIVSYWDGTGSTVQRLGADARPVGDPIELRSGDERGGHTDGRIAVSARSIAVSWLVAPPMMNHGMADEQPRRPGPRLAVLRCAH